MSIWLLICIRMFLILSPIAARHVSHGQRRQYGRQTAYKEIIGLPLSPPLCHIIIPDLISDMIHKIAASRGVSST